MGARKVPSPRSTRVTWPSPLPIRGARRPRRGSSTHADRRGTAMPTTSSTLGGRAKRRRGRQQATTLGGVDSTTAMRIARRRRNPREPACSAGRSARRPFPSASARPQPSSSTTGRRTPACGLTTTV
jgi:hypothetical protein